MTSWNGVFFLKKKGNIVLQFENKFLTVYNFKCVGKSECYELMLKSFCVIFAGEGDILWKPCSGIIMSTCVIEQALIILHLSLLWIKAV